MSLNQLKISERHYLYSRCKCDGALWRFENVLAEDRAGKAILCKGTVNNFAEILPILHALGKALDAGLDFTLLLPRGINFCEKIQDHLKLLELAERTVFLNDPSVYAENCLELLELPSAALGSVWLTKRRCLVANCADDIFEKLMARTGENA